LYSCFQLLLLLLLLLFNSKISILSEKKTSQIDQLTTKKGLRERVA